MTPAEGTSFARWTVGTGEEYGLKGRTEGLIDDVLHRTSQESHPLQFHDGRENPSWVCGFQGKTLVTELCRKEEPKPNSHYSYKKDSM